MKLGNYNCGWWADIGLSGFVIGHSIRKPQTWPTHDDDEEPYTVQFTKSFSFFWTPTLIKDMRRLARNQNDIQIFGPFRYSNTVG